MGHDHDTADHTDPVSARPSRTDASGTDPSGTDRATDVLADTARAAQQHSYSPYSGYRVGAALRASSGTIYTGCNVENAAYPEGVCAEGGTISAMVRGGDREIDEIVTITDGDRPGSPCGGCRQKIREFSTPATRIRSLAVGSSDVLEFTMAELLPDSFGRRISVRCPTLPVDDPTLPG